MMKSRYYAGAGLAACAVIVCLCSAPAFATSYTFGGTSSAELLTSGPNAGYYEYTIDIWWDLPGALSHWNLIMKAGNATPDHLIWFDEPAGYSENGTDPVQDDWDTEWEGFYVPTGDKSFDPDILLPVIKWNNPVATTPDGSDPGKIGYGTFSFYSNIIPGPIPTDTTIREIVAKDGHQTQYLGDLTGEWPSCTIIPEPLTMVGVFMGVCGLGGYIRRKRRRA